MRSDRWSRGRRARVHSRPVPAIALDDVARVAQRLGTLLGAGLPPPSAWRYALRDEGETSLAEDVAILVRNCDDEGFIAALERWGESQGELALSGVADLCAVWLLARDCGGSLGMSLEYLAEALRERANALRELHDAAVGPRSTMKLMLVLPLIGLLCAEAMGFDSLGQLCATGPGIAALLCGSGLMLCGWLWSGAIMRRAQRSPPDDGVVLELWRIALSGGTSPDRAREAVAGVLRRIRGDSAVREYHCSEGIAESVLEVSVAAGVPAALLLHGEATLLRDRRRSQARRALARAEVRLLIPLSVAGLPAFLCLGVVPLALAVLSTLSR